MSIRRLQVRTLTANYMIPSAVWKSSYRLVFEGGGATLEGWAIVDNTTDEDWSSVRLALVSGRPISFISALYGPRYKQRPTARLAEYDAVDPVVYDGAIGSGDGVAKVFIPPPVAVAAGGRGEGGGVGGGTYRVTGSNPAPKRRGITDSTILVATEGAERGDLFEYAFDTPVTVKRSESAMLPFLQQKLKTRKLLVFQEALGANPRTAAELTNSTGKTLDGGPITVYDGGSYAGEALVATMKAGDQRLVSYAIDLGTRVATAIDSGAAQVRLVSASRGELHARVSTLATKTYTIRNVDAKTKTMIIEHPIRAEYRLISPKPVETTASAYRFEVKLDAKSTGTYVVKEENLYEDTYSVPSLTPDILFAYVNGWPLSASAKAQMTTIAVRKKALLEAESLIGRIESYTREVTRDQERLRENIKTLNNVAGQQEQVQKYARHLADGDSKLMTLANQLKDGRVKRQALEAAVADLVGKLEF